MVHPMAARAVREKPPAFPNFQVGEAVAPKWVAFP